MRTDRRDRPGRNPRRRNDERPRTHSGDDEWIYGRNAVNESMKAGSRRFHRILMLESAGGDERLQAIEQRARERRIPVDRVDREAIELAVGDVNHQGVAALVSPYAYASPDILEQSADSMLALDHLVDPQNVGTLLRASEAFGIRRVIMPKDRAARITPAVVNSSAGAVEHLSIVQVVNLAQELERLRKLGYWIVGIENKEQAAVLGEVEIPAPCVLVIGSEGQGMSPNIAKRCDLLIKIEMRGQVNSLNAATAGSIALFEISRH